MKKEPVFILLGIVILGIAGLAYYRSFADDLQEPAKEETSAVDDVAENKLDEEAVCIRDLKDINLRLSLNVLEGDLSGVGPTYRDHIVVITGITQSLTERLDGCQLAVKDNTISENVRDRLVEVKDIEMRLQQSLFRGDAESAPSFEEFNDKIRVIQADLAKIMLQI